MSSANSITLHTDPGLYPGVAVYAVAGNPISHSKSPAIHQRFAEQSNQRMHYGRLQPELDSFAQAAKDFFAAGGKGMNVTVPFKLDAQNLADVLTPRAQLAGAVNTLWKTEGKIFGDNTDGAGLVRDLLAQGIALPPAAVVAKFRHILPQAQNAYEIAIYIFPTFMCRIRLPQLLRRAFLRIIGLQNRHDRQHLSQTIFRARL